MSNAEIIADQDYYFDVDGKVSTDPVKGIMWLARKGDAVLAEHREVLEAFQKSGKVAQPAENPEKSDDPKENKRAEPSKNKGVK